MTVSLKTDLRFPESGQQGHGTRITHKLKSLIDRMDLWYKYDSKNPFEIGNMYFVEYENIVKKIKMAIRRIEENGGMPLYLDFNKKIWRQLYGLSFTSSENTLYYVNDIYSGDKKILNRILEDRFVQANNYKEIRKSLMFNLATTVACLNGIKRYLNYVKKREDRFAKLNRRLTRIGGVQRIVGALKDNV